MKKNICHSCLKECKDSFCYTCSKLLFAGRKVSHLLEFTLPEFTDLKLREGNRISISGAQLKHSLKLDKNKLRLIQSGGEYILKPVPRGVFMHLDQLPANEHLTMQIAKQVFGISTAPNAYIYFADKKPAYITRRFDISPSGGRFVVEDFAQIAQKTEESDGQDYKYNYSYEEIGALIAKYAAASGIESEKFFRLVIFNYVISNGDAHLKNFSMYRNNEYGDYLLTPAYDLVCTRIHSPYESDMALELFADGYESEGYKAGSKYLTEDFMEFGERLGIKNTTIEIIINEFVQSEAKVRHLVENSFLSSELRKEYLKHYKDKMQRIYLPVK